jgi:hypothetical protein
MLREDIAKIVHAANRAVCEIGRDFSQKSWDEAEDWQRQAAIDGVNFHLDNPSLPDSASHEAWCKQKYADGWTYGKVKDPNCKKHPDLVPFNQLSELSKAKDAVFAGIVNALAKYVD